MIDNSSTTKFFIVGAPKCGTTSLASWLSSHPNVFLPSIKEPHYFSTDLANRAVSSESSYRHLYKDVAQEHIAMGEASTWYLSSEVAVPSILRCIPDARFIIMTRDQVEMARSLHHHNVRVMNEDEADFGRAWDLQANRMTGQDIPRDCPEPFFLQYGPACLLGRQVERLLRLVPPEKVLHVPLSGLKADPASHYKRVLAFIGAPNEERSQFLVSNPARGHRSRTFQRVLRAGARVRLALGINRGFGLSRLNGRSLGKASISVDLRSKVDAYFAKDNELLKTCLEEL